MINKFDTFFTHLMHDHNPTQVVKYPQFFKIERDGRYAYLLGTNHSLTLAVLPSYCLKLISTCRHCIIESSGTVSEQELQDIAQNFGKYFCRTEYEPTWFNLLDGKEQQTISKYFDLYFKQLQIPIKFPEGIDLGILKLAMVCDIVQYASRPLLFSLCVGDRGKIDEPICGMDLQLADLFNDELGLEGYFDILKFSSTENCDLDYFRVYLKFIDFLETNAASKLAPRECIIKFFAEYTQEPEAQKTANRFYHDLTSIVDADNGGLQWYQTCDYAIAWEDTIEDDLPLCQESCRL